MIVEQELKAQDVRTAMQEVVQEHLTIEANGYVLTNEMVYDVLLKAATENISIDAACRDLEQSVGGNTLRDTLNEHLKVEELRQHEERLNNALCVQLPRRLGKIRLEAAIDEHDEPCYGKSPALRD